MKQLGKQGTKGAISYWKQLKNWLGIEQKQTRNDGLLRLDLQFFASKGIDNAYDLSKANLSKGSYNSAGDSTIDHYKRHGNEVLKKAE